MRTLIFGIVLIVLIGIGGFFYRSVMEQTAEPVACTMEAKVCPDGSSVGRVAPACEFAACPAPVVQTYFGLSFQAPAGYLPDADISSTPAFVKSSLSDSVRHTIIMRSFPIGAGQTGNSVILANTRYQPSDMQAEDFSRFETSIINGREYRSTVIERFEGLVHSAYYLVRADDVIRFEVIEHDVTNWTDADLVVSELPEHQALLSLLASISGN